MGKLGAVIAIVLVLGMMGYSVAQAPAASPAKSPAATPTKSPVSSPAKTPTASASPAPSTSPVASSPAPASPVTTSPSPSSEDSAPPSSAGAPTTNSSPAPSAQSPAPSSDGTATSASSATAVQKLGDAGHGREPIIQSRPLQRRQAAATSIHRAIQTSENHSPTYHDYDEYPSSWKDKKIQIVGASHGQDSPDRHFDNSPMLRATTYLHEL